MMVMDDDDDNDGMLRAYLPEQWTSLLLVMMMIGGGRWCTSLTCYRWRWYGSGADAATWLRSPQMTYDDRPSWWTHEWVREKASVPTDCRPGVWLYYRIEEGLSKKQLLYYGWWYEQRATLCEATLMMTMSGIDRRKNMDAGPVCYIPMHNTVLAWLIAYHII